MMKNFKLFLLSFALIAGFLTSCSNEDTVVEEQDIEQTEAITESLTQLARQFDAEGDLMPMTNPSGNIVFDFGFDFVYPLNLSFNNGTTVTVNSLDELIDIIINSTEDLYVDGIEFPFDVEVYNEDTNSIEVITINNEDDFFNLLDSFDWDNQDPCECFEDYNPVCVEVEAPDGVNFTITYPNECYALCDGFTPNDFVDNCAEDTNNTGGFECFELNFPITIITDDQQTITVNSQEELDNALYNVYYFDFVYPFEVTTEEGEVETINDADDFYDVLEDCFDDYDYDDCELDIEILEEALILCDTFEVYMYNPVEEVYIDLNYIDFNENGEIIVNGNPGAEDSGIWNITVSNESIILTISGLQTFTTFNTDWELVNCDEDLLEFSNNITFSIFINLDCENTVVEPCDECEDEEFIPVCVQVELPNGGAEIITFPNACYAECEGFNTSDFVDCGGNTSDCTTDAVLEILLECPWTANGTTYDFEGDGTVAIEGSGLSTIGTWTIMMGNEGYPIVTIFANIGNFNDEWHFVDCNLINSLLVVSSNNPATDIALNCD